MLRSFLVLAGAAVAALALAVAGTSGGPSATGQFPVTVVGSNGKVTVTKRPTRIVSLSPTATESLFAIGAGPWVVAVDDQSDFPKSAPRTALSGFTPNVEAIAAYRPDLVVYSYETKGLSESLRRLGITVLQHDAAKSFKGAYQQIRQLGKVTGRDAAAAKVVGGMKTTIGRMVKRARSSGGRLSVYHELTPDLYSATSKTFVGQVYTALGLRNIADEVPDISTPAIRSCPRSTSSRRAPTSSFSRTRSAVDRSRRRSHPVRAGIASTRSGAGRSCESTTRSPRAGAPGS